MAEHDTPVLFLHPREDELPTVPVLLDLKVSVDLAHLLKALAEDYANLPSDADEPQAEWIYGQIHDAMELASGLLKGALHYTLRGEDVGRLKERAEEEAKPHYPKLRKGD